MATSGEAGEGRQLRAGLVQGGRRSGARDLRVPGPPVDDADLVDDDHPFDGRPGGEGDLEGPPPDATGDGDQQGATRSLVVSLVGNDERWSPPALFGSHRGREVQPDDIAGSGRP